MASPEGDLVQFAPFSSAVDVAFWHKLKENKLEVYQLDDKPKPLQANYTNSKLYKLKKNICQARKSITFASKNP